VKRKSYWQKDYAGICLLEVIEKAIGYKWNIYVPGVEKPIESGWNLHFIDALTECQRQYARLDLAGISEWWRNV